MREGEANGERVGGGEERSLRERWKGERVERGKEEDTKVTKEGKGGDGKARRIGEEERRG